MINGAPATENLRGQPYDMYIEDAVQETTVASSGISAEYGRFTGGVINVVTKSGGNTFKGSFRDTLQNDKWRAYTPFEKIGLGNGSIKSEPRVDTTVPTYEYTLGGPVVRDRLWFFTAGRFQTQESSRTLVVTNIPYVFRDKQQRYEANATYSPRPGQRIQGVYVGSTSDQTNATQSTQSSMDTNSLFDPKRLMDLSTITYSGVLSSQFFVEGRVSVRNETYRDVGARSRELDTGTLLIDRNNRRYWSATFCGVCGPEERDAQDFFFKGSYFLSTKELGSHDMAFGVDSYNDSRLANNHQSGSDFRIVGTLSSLKDGNIIAAFPNDGTTQIVWQPIQRESLGSNFRTHSLFYNDSWRISNRVTANLGLRYDRNHGVNGVGDLIARDSAWSPRLGLMIDPAGDQKWSITAGYAKYVAALANTIADVSSPGGNADAYAYEYKGDPISANRENAEDTAAAIRQVFDWFRQNGGTDRPTVGAVTARGLTPRIDGSLKSPNAREFSAGVSREIEQRGSVRADFVYRAYHDFYAQRTDLSTGNVPDTRPGIPPSARDRRYDLTLIENTDLLKRRYAGATFQAQYRPRARVDVGATYTLSRLWGNVDGENVNSGPTASDVLQYPEYKQASWNYPEGDLSADQRHRARGWINYGLPGPLSDVTVGVLQVMESGVPYGAVGTVDSSKWLPANPGYLSPPTGSVITYYYTARDAFRTEGQRRTDAAINFAHRLRNSLEVFGQFQVINVFNNYQLCACGSSTVFANGGAVIPNRIDQTLSLSSNNAAFAAFNPFTTVPQRGVNWDYATKFGYASNRQAYTTPRTLRLSVGVRF
jgi:hypothetical protein